MCGEGKTLSFLYYFSPSVEKMKIIFILHMCVFVCVYFVSMSLCNVNGLLRSKEGVGLLELDLQMVVSQHVGAEK